MKALGDFGAAFCCFGLILIVIGLFTFMVGDTVVITLGTYICAIGAVMALAEMAWASVRGHL